MSEAIIIALIGVIPSVTVALVTIISNNETIKSRIKSIEYVASEYHHYEEELQELRHQLANCEARYLGLTEHVNRLEHRKYRRNI